MYCSNCGNDAGQSKFCPNCGAEIQPSAAQNKPLYEMPNTEVENFNLFTAYASMFKKYAQFSGRSRRSEFWFAGLMNFIIVSILYFVLIVPRIDYIGYEEDLVVIGIGAFLIGIYSLITLIPNLALYVRRLHDTGKSGWCLLLGLIPFFGGIILFVFSVLDSQPGTNQYGPNPKGR